ncbi:hypothetical protein N1F78_10665 [Seonamhaeicola sp. MEBiC1930]|uniref:ARPP-1 family domain-containing protein n=1 Tax=Seonamhaeicola sp. MEBiC01930 TaxID=2976768 RepID=UPI0032545BE8
MKTNVTINLLFVFFILFTACNKKDSSAKVAINTQETTYILDGIKINSPKSIENLSIFMLSGKEQIVGDRYNILSESMKNKEVTVFETGNVNQLSVNNNSNEYVFIHSGDIVKGGKQDRTISFDVIVAPMTNNVSLESFCVEQGRWEQRAEEEVIAFSSNTKMISSKDLKLAAKHERNQSKVWDKVSEQKENLNEKLSLKKGYAVDVSDNESKSSLQLALESDELIKVRDDYFEKLKDLIKQKDVIGYAYTINGEIFGVEVYNNKQLFQDLWDKILESVIIEAVTNEGEKLASKKGQKDILAFMNVVKAQGKKEVKNINEVTNFETIENETGNVVFTTIDLHQKNWVHKSFMKIDSTDLNKRRSANEIIIQE